MVTFPSGEHMRKADAEGLPFWDQVKDHHDVRERDKTETTVEWFKIVGSAIVERNIWPGKYIPFVRVIGEETVIDGTLDRKGPRSRDERPAADV